MRFKADLLALGALACMVACAPAASAQTIYRCASGASVTYTDKPCSKRIVNLDPAPVPVQSLELRRRQQRAAMVRAMRRRPGETAGQFEIRRRRARLLPQDRDECARIEVRMPVEQASLNNPDPEEAAKAHAALDASRKRWGELRC